MLIHPAELVDWLQLALNPGVAAALVTASTATAGDTCDTALAPRWESRAGKHWSYAMPWGSELSESRLSRYKILELAHDGFPRLLVL